MTVTGRHPDHLVPSGFVTFSAILAEVASRATAHYDDDLI
jgi:hypothetical protein